jgi:hypothetical protein
MIRHLDVLHVEVVGDEPGSDPPLVLHNGRFNGSLVY